MADSHELTSEVSPAAQQSPRKDVRRSVLKKITSREIPTYIEQVQAPNGNLAMIVVERLPRVASITDEMAAAWVRDARAAAALHHPNVVRGRAITLRKEDIVVACDFVDGERLIDLRKAATTGGSPPAIEIIARILLDVLAGLGALHALADSNGRELGLAHGEVTGETVLVGADGISRLLHTCRIRRPSAALQNDALWMAPEMAAGDPTSIRSDLFSVGVLLWQALRGEFAADAELVSKVRSGTVERATAPERASWAEPLSAVAARAMSTAPDARYPSAGAMSDEIRKIVDARLPAHSQVAAFVATNAGSKIEARRHLTPAAHRAPTTSSGTTTAAQATPPDVAKTAIPPVAQPEPIVATPTPEPIMAAPKPEPIVAAPKPEPIVAAPKPEPVVAVPKPEPIVAREGLATTATTPKTTGTLLAAGKSTTVPKTQVPAKGVTASKAHPVAPAAAPKVEATAVAKSPSAVGSSPAKAPLEPTAPPPPKAPVMAPRGAMAPTPSAAKVTAPVAPKAAPPVAKPAPAPAQSAVAPAANAHVAPRATPLASKTAPAAPKAPKTGTPAPVAVVAPPIQADDAPTVAPKAAIWRSDRPALKPPAKAGAPVAVPAMPGAIEQAPPVEPKVVIGRGGPPLTPGGGVVPVSLLADEEDIPVTTDSTPPPSHGPPTPRFVPPPPRAPSLDLGLDPRKSPTSVERRENARENERRPQEKRNTPAATPVTAPASFTGQQPAFARSTTPSSPVAAEASRTRGARRTKTMVVSASAIVALAAAWQLSQRQPIAPNVAASTASPIPPAPPPAMTTATTSPLPASSPVKPDPATIASTAPPAVRSDESASEIPPEPTVESTSPATAPGSKGSGTPAAPIRPARPSSEAPSPASPSRPRRRFDPTRI